MEASEGARPPTRSAFLKRIGEVASELGYTSFKGHSLCIGSTLDYLLKGIPFDVVKSMGRWPSDTFTLYLCQHAVVMAPYLQYLPGGPCQNRSPDTPCLLFVNIQVSNSLSIPIYVEFNSRHVDSTTTSVHLSNHYC